MIGGMSDPTIPPPPGPPAEALPPPPTGATAPATVPTANNGLIGRGRTQVSMAMKILTEALGLVGADTPEGQDIVAMLKLGGKKFGQATGGLEQAEAKMLMDKAPPVSVPTPAQGNAFADAIRSKLAAPPAPAPEGAMPGAMPLSPQGG
jgi:hypothetical protein